MRFVAEQLVLAGALAAASRIAARNTGVPVLSCALIEADEHGVRVMADNGDMRVTLPIKADEILPGRVALPALVISNVIKGCKAGAVTVEADSSDLKIKAGSARFTLATIDASLLSSMWESEWPHKLDLAEGALSFGLRSCAHSIAMDKARSYLSGVYLRADGDKLDFVSTDGHRMTIVDQVLGVPVEGAFGVILPDNASAEALKLAGKGMVRIATSDRTIRFEFSTGVILLSKLIEGSFPDYRRFLSMQGDKVVVVDRGVITDRLARVAVVAGDRGRTVRFAFAPTQAVLSVSYLDNGAKREARDTFDVETESEVEINLNATYVREALDALDCETVEVRLKDSASVSVLTPYGKTSPICFIMPMRG